MINNEVLKRAIDHALLTIYQNQSNDFYQNDKYIKSLQDVYKIGNFDLIKYLIKLEYIGIICTNYLYLTTLGEEYVNNNIVSIRR